MEVCVGYDQVVIVVEVAASLSEDGIEMIDGVEVIVGDGLVDKRPQVFGRLQFGRVGR